MQPIEQRGGFVQSDARWWGFDVRGVRRRVRVGRSLCPDGRTERLCVRSRRKRGARDVLEMTVADAGGNTVVVIEHNLAVIAAADWIVDLGPDRGMSGNRPGRLRASSIHPCGRPAHGSIPPAGRGVWRARQDSNLRPSA